MRQTIPFGRFNLPLHPAGALVMGILNVTPDSFSDVGPQEARAWTVHTGATAPEAAGEIHSDFQKGFIRAETIAYDDYVALGGEARAREAGKLRAEGKAYVVHDGDVMHFLHS
eukprot:gene31941-39461_t